MKKIFPVLLITCGSFPLLHGQVFLDRQVISCFALNAGSEIQILSTAGQPEFLTFGSDSFILTQGFEQACDMDTAKVEYTVSLDECTGIFTIEIESMSGCLTDTAHIFWDDIEGENVFENAPPVIALDVYGKLGCHFETTIDISLEEIELITCPEDFYQLITPNEDGANDAWIIELAKTPSFAQNRVTIFNRWGGEVWSASNYDNDNTVWKGRSNGGEDLPDGTYFYTVEAGNLAFKGFVELQR